MNGDRPEPLQDSQLRDVARKAAWIAVTFGSCRCRLLFNGGYAWGPLSNSRCSFDFEWGSVRIRAVRIEPIRNAEVGESAFPGPEGADAFGDDETSVIISLKRERAVRVLGLPLFRHRRFYEVFVCDFSRELPRLKLPEGAARDELIALISSLYDGLQKLLVRKALSLNEIRILPRRELEHMLSEEFGIRS